MEKHQNAKEIEIIKIITIGKAGEQSDPTFPGVMKFGCFNLFDCYDGLTMGKDYFEFILNHGPDQGK